jgi:hypothetical protein
MMNTPSVVLECKTSKEDLKKIVSSFKVNSGGEEGSSLWVSHHQVSLFIYHNPQVNADLCLQQSTNMPVGGSR